MVLLAPALLAPLAGCGDARTATAGTGWERLPDPPLPPRLHGVVATVDDRVVALGGDQGPPCPPDADCVDRSDHAVDGAAYDPATGRWTPIADAPERVTEYAVHAVVGTTLHVVGKAGDLLSYDAPADRWSSRPFPGGGTWWSLAPAGDRLLAYPGSNEAEGRDLPDLVLGDDGWEELPEHPLGRLFDRQLVAAGDDTLVLLGKRILPGGGIEDPALLRGAVLRDGSWTELPSTRQLGGSGFTWTGERLVDATTGGADGGETDNYGEVLPFGGTLDPATGTWGRLPDVPDELSGGWPAYTRQPRPDTVVARDGWVYDDASRTWTEVPRPAGGPDEPGPATWLGRDLVVVGGRSDPDTVVVGEMTAEDTYDRGAWVLRR
ncbi:hypothetical protein GCM10028771_21510 [Nocardioides marmoraquaticus]